MPVPNNRAALLTQLREQPSPASMDDIIGWARSGSMTDADILELARLLADSGDILSLGSANIYADVASTGGPSSLSTLLCPLFLRFLGAHVPKLGVPGRPAGAIDALAQVPKYRLILNSRDAIDILNRCGYAHFLASAKHAPLDGALFEHRKNVGAIAIPELVIASLLSKKIAVGLIRVGLDVRVSPFGNFGSSWSEAKSISARFVRVSAAARIIARCFLTNGRKLCQPFIGRGEALVGLADLIEGRSSEWLAEHARVCFRMAQILMEKESTKFPSSIELREVLEANLEAQGSSWEHFMEKVANVRRQRRIIMTSDKSGFLSVDLGKIRSALVAANRSRQNDDPATATFTDNVGLIMRMRSGAAVSSGDIVAEVRSEQGSPNEIVANLRAAICVAPEIESGDGIEFEVV